MEVKTYVGEIGYLELLKKVCEEGVDQPSRAGNVRSLFGGQLVFDQHSPPIFVSRKINYRLSFEEFWFFLQGKTQTKELEERGVNFWKGNTSRDFLDKRGLSHLDEGDMGKAYGYQLRYYNDQIDQVRNVLETLKTDPTSRRLYTTMWNPSQENEMALPPCWHSHQFVVIGDTLNLKLINRSLDILYGAPFAVFQYWLYLHAVARMANLKVGSMVCDLSHIHIYEDQLGYVGEYLENLQHTDIQTRMNKLKGICINKDIDIKSLNDILSLTWDDVVVENYDPVDFKSNKPKPKMAV